MLRIFPNILLAIPLMSAIAMAQTPIEQAKKQPTKGQKYRYEILYHGNGFSAHAQVDASKPAGQRVTIVHPKSSSIPDEFQAVVQDLDKGADEFPWCRQFLEQIPTKANLQFQDASTATYQFVPLPSKTADAEEKKIMKNSIGMATLGQKKPGLLSFQVVLQQPTKINLAAELKSLSVNVECEYVADGRTRLKKLTNSVSGKAFFQKFNQTETIELINFRVI